MRDRSADTAPMGDTPEVRRSVPAWIVRDALDVVGPVGRDVAAALTPGLDGAARDMLFLPVDHVRLLVRALWSATGDELLGLGRAPVPMGSLRLMLYATSTGHTVREQLKLFRRLQGAVPGYPRMTLTEDDRHAHIGFDLTPIPHPSGVFVALLLTMVRGYLEWVVDTPVPTVSVQVPATCCRPQTYLSLYAAPVRLTDGRASLTVDRRWLDVPTVVSAHALESLTGEALYRLVLDPRRARLVSDEVRSLLLARGVERGLPTVGEVAEALGMSEPTLRRRLHREGTSPTGVRDVLLRDYAFDLLLHSDATVADIGHRLGFSEASTFSRAFRRWCGVSPGRYRRDLVEKSPPARVDA